VLVILHVVIEYEQVAASDLVEITSPWDVGWLQNNNIHSLSPVVFVTM